MYLAPISFSLGRLPKLIKDLKNEDDLKYEDDLKNEDHLKNEDGLKIEDNIKNEDNLNRTNFSLGCHIQEFI